MKNYCIGFCVSFLLHALAVGAVLYVCYSVPEPESTMLLVDFSAIETGPFNIGGESSGGRQISKTAGAAGELEQAVKRANNIESMAEASETADTQHVEVSGKQEEASLFAPSDPENSETPERLEPEQDKALARPDALLNRMPDPKESVQQAKSKNEPKKQDSKSKERKQPVLKRPGRAGNTGQGTRTAATGSGIVASGPGSFGGEPGTGKGTGSGKGEGWEQGVAAGYVKSNYGYINRRIAEHLEYPSQARRMGWQGVAKFSFIIDRDGSVESIRLVAGSGYPMLDEAAEKAIRNAEPFLPAPEVRVRIVIPIVFRLT